MGTATKSAEAGTTLFYDSHAQDYSESTIGLDVRELREPFLKELRPGSHILDAGCGSGRDSKAFLDRGYRVTAIDASPGLARLASAYTGLQCEVLAFQEMQFREEFDGVWACASLLHVPLRDIDNVMTRFVRALKPGGVFYISLKEGQGERIAEDGRFFNYYSLDSFRKLLARCPALREASFWTTPEIRSLKHREPWLNFLLLKTTET